MDCFKQKRRRKKEVQEQQKFRQLTPHTSPPHSQSSTLSLSQGPDPPRLPKVGSYGLWVGAPGIYASTPSPAYAIGGGKPGGRTHYLMQPAVMQRASSDPRLAQSRGPVHSTGGSQQRIYHSQGLPSPLSPVYEIRDPVNGSVYDVYQIGGGSTTRLLQDKSSGKGGKRLQRSQSDVVTEPSKRAYRTKPSSAELRASRASSNKGTLSSSTTERSVSLNKHNTDNLNNDTARIPQPKDLDEPVLIESVEKSVQEEKVTVAASATDSMKLLAKNKTDDQKTVGQSENPPPVPENNPVSGNISTSSPSTTVVPASTSSSLHYSYQGDIYAVPDKEALRSRPRNSDPLPAQGVEDERPGTTNERGSDPITSITETAHSLVLNDNPGNESGVVRNPVYQEVGEPSLTHSSIYEEVGGILQNNQDKTGREAGKSNTEATSPGVGSTVGSSGDTYEVIAVLGEEAGSEVAAASGDLSARDVGASGESGHRRGSRKLREQWSFDSEGTTDELTRAGKHISVTAEAFGFLDTYLSDEDGADISSPPKSPVLTDRSAVM